MHYALRTLPVAICRPTSDERRRLQFVYNAYYADCEEECLNSQLGDRLVKVPWSGWQCRCIITT